jgi:hypothetical protein
MPNRPQPSPGTFRLWMVAGLVVLVAGFAASTQIDSLQAEDTAARAEDGDGDRGTSTTADDRTPTSADDSDGSDGSTTTSTGTDDLGGLGDLLPGDSEPMDPLPGRDWSDEARADFVAQCLDSQLEAIFSSALSPLSPEEGCACIYDEVEASGQATFDEFNDALTAADIDVSHPGAVAMNGAAWSCGLQASSG